MHINCLELLAAVQKDRSDLRVLLRIDNTTAVAYINHLGRTVSKDVVTLTKDLWMWCLEKNIYISTQHLPWVLNTIADAESRNLRDRSDWMLDQTLLRR